MSPLNIHPEEEVAVPKKKKNKSLKVMLGIAALVAVPVVGTTLAASIGINSGGNVNFGQGSVATAACDDAITTEASSSYETVSSTAAFYLKTITLSGIDLTSGKCAGKSFIVSVDGGSGTEVNISTGVKQVSFTIPGTAGAASTDLTGVTSGFTAVMTNASGAQYKTNSTAVAYDDAAKIIITITAPIFASASVTKFLVQSS
jgi:hypothetical protein